MASIALNKHFEEFIREQVAKGRFNNASEVVRAGLRLLEDTEAGREEKLRKLDAAIAKGLAEAEAGLGVPLDEAMDRLRERLGLPVRQPEG
ncbi:MAG: type II toxin-antitoxin system ParD family antitoxin [Bauldia sp.]